jgi:putative ABC transport system permease protein
MYTDLRKMAEQGVIPDISVDPSSSVVFSKSYANNLGVKTGDKINIKHFPYNGDQKVKVTLTVVSIIDFIPGDGTDGNVLIDRSNPFLKTNKELPLRSVFLDIDESNRTEVLNGLNELQREYTEISWGDLQTQLESIHQQMNQRFTILWAVLAVVSLIGCFGIVNTLSASIHAQRREYAILRAVRITPYELKKIIVLQGVLFSCIAIIIGIATGIFMTYGFSLALDAKFIISWKTLTMVGCSVILISLIASFPIAHNLSKKTIIRDLTLDK